VKGFKKLLLLSLDGCNLVRISKSFIVAWLVVCPEKTCCSLFRGSFLHPSLKTSYLLVLSFLDSKVTAT
jgi:hypothetical protein